MGMSKGGSRYGRRSNWFKIHYLIPGAERDHQSTSTTNISNTENKEVVPVNNFDKERSRGDGLVNNRKKKRFITREREERDHSQSGVDVKKQRIQPGIINGISQMDSENCNIFDNLHRSLLNPTLEQSHTIRQPFNHFNIPELKPIPVLNPPEVNPFLSQIFSPFPMPVFPTQCNMATHNILVYYQQLFSSQPKSNQYLKSNSRLALNNHNIININSSPCSKLISQKETLPTAPSVICHTTENLNDDDSALNRTGITDTQNTVFHSTINSQGSPCNYATNNNEFETTTTCITNSENPIDLSITHIKKYPQEISMSRSQNQHGKESSTSLFKSEEDEQNGHNFPLIDEEEPLALDLRPLGKL